MSDLIGTKDLGKWLGSQEKPLKGKALEKYLNDNSIPYFYGRDGLCTTIGLIHASKGFKTASNDNDSHESKIETLDDMLKDGT